MRHPKRSLTLVYKVVAMMVAVMWAVSRREAGSSVAVIVLAAFSLTELRGRPRGWRSAGVIITNLAAALGLAIAIDRTFVPIVLGIWAALTALAMLTQVLSRTAARQALFAGLRRRSTGAHAGQIVTTAR